MSRDRCYVTWFIIWWTQRSEVKGQVQVMLTHVFFSGIVFIYPLADHLLVCSNKKYYDICVSIGATRTVRSDGFGPSGRNISSLFTQRLR